AGNGADFPRTEIPPDHAIDHQGRTGSVIGGVIFGIELQTRQKAEIKTIGYVIAISNCRYERAITGAHGEFCGVILRPGCHDIEGCAEMMFVPRPIQDEGCYRHIGKTVGRLRIAESINVEMHKWENNLRIDLGAK